MSKENEESISDYRLNTLARNQLIEERTMNGDRACAVLAYSIIVETAQESESRAIKLFRRCVNDRLLSTALNAGMSPEEVGRVWLKAPFRLLEEALRISLSDKNACRAQSANLIAGLRFAAAFSPRASHSIRVKYLISFAKTYPEFLDLFPNELVNDLCLQIVDICLHCDKKELRDYANACMALMKQERLLDTLGAELVPLLNINEPNEKFFRLFEESVFGMILLEKTLLLTNTLINGDQLLKYAEVFVRRPDTICEGIRMVDLIYQRSETIATSSTNRIADASAKTLGYGSRVQLHDRVVRFLLEIDESSELAIRINSTSRDNLLTLPSLTQSAKALVQLGNFIDKNEYSDLANRVCTLMLVRPAEEALEAFTTLCAGYVDCSIISALILGFLSLSRKLSLGLVETARYLAPLQQIESLSGHDLLEQFRQETFDHEVLHILICWGAYFFDQRLGILRASLEWEHGTLQPSQSVNPESRKSFESLKKLPAACKWPLLLYNSDKAKSLHASAELDANQLDKSFRRVFLAEYSIDDILGLVNDLEESRVIEMTEWYIQQLPPDSFKHIITQVAAGTGEIIIFLKTLCRVSLQAFPCEEALPWLISLLQDETSKVAIWLRDAAPKFPSGDSLRYYHSLTGEDIALVKRWNDGKPLSAVEASRLLSARVAEKFLYDILSSFYGRENIRDVSKEQLYDPSVDPEWPRYDIYVTTSEEAIDCKNARKAYNSQFFSQYQIPRFKSQRKKGSSVVYACTLSDYIRAESFDVTSDLSLLQSCHCLQGDVCVSLLGVISQKLFQSLQDCLARHSVPLER